MKRLMSIGVYSLGVMYIITEEGAKILTVEKNENIDNNVNIVYIGSTELPSSTNRMIHVVSDYDEVPEGNLVFLGSAKVNDFDTWYLFEEVTEDD